jgi:hypothetical protein
MNERERMNPSYRSPTLRLSVSVRCKQVQAPPWHDLWEITMDETSLTELSTELLQLPDPLTPRLHQLRRLVESVITKNLDAHPADWEHGCHPATLRNQESVQVPTST